MRGAISLAIRITLYNNYYKDEQIASTKIDFISQAMEAIDSLLRGTEYDILITRKELDE